VLYPLIYTREFPAHRKSPFIGSLMFVKRSRLFATCMVVLESSINDRLRGYREVSAMNEALTITRLIFLIPWLCSYSSAAGSTVGVTEVDNLIAGVLDFGRFKFWTSACSSGESLMRSFTICNVVSLGIHLSGAFSR
jgi:hypothetical protein